MTIESNNPNKAKMLCYGIAFANVSTTVVGYDICKNKKTAEDVSFVKSYNYHLTTNDDIPEDKFKEIEIAIALIMNPNLEIPEQGRYEPTK